MIKKKEWIVLFLVPIVFSFICILLRAHFFEMIIIFFGILSLYFSFKQRKYIKSTATFALVLLPLMMIIDYLTTLNGTWAVSPSLIPMKLFGISNLENVLWGVLRVYTVVILYRIVTKDKEREMRSVSYITMIAGGIFFLFFLLVKLYPFIFHLKNLYLLIGIIFGVIPTIIYFFIYQQKFHSLIIPTFYFFYYCLFFEFTGIYLHNWAFTGKDYLATITLFHLTLPLEEVIWLMCGSGVILIYFEFFHGGQN